MIPWLLPAHGSSSRAVIIVSSVGCLVVTVNPQDGANKTEKAEEKAKASEKTALFNFFY